MKTLALLLILLHLSIWTQAQLTVQNGQTAQQLANRLAGPDITTFNAVLYDTANIQSGTFDYIGNDLGLNSGVILSTGHVLDAVGPNSSTATSGGHPLGVPYVDSILEVIANRNILNLTYLEFEFEAPGDEIAFNFVFLSEEYNEYIGRAFNDAFAFVISGPGIVGEENIALIPNTTVPITTGTVNYNSHWQYFIDNDSGTVNIEYDGFTSRLTARKTGLQPCGVYKLSLRIADGSNDLFDSAVMLEANSLTSNSIAAIATTYSTDTTALEGCIPARYTFDLGFPASHDLNIPIRLGGTALNGVDYESIDSIITIPAGQTSSTIIINALSDGLVEGRETIELYYKTSTSSCVPEDTLVLYIDDATPLSYTTIGTNLVCNDDQSGSVQVNITGGTAPYSVTYRDVLTGITQNIPANALPISNLDAGTYVLDVYDQYGCTADAIVSGGLFNAGQTFLPDGTGVSYTNDIAISGFNVGQNLTNINQINSICATLEHSYAGDLGIELIAPNGATIQLKGVGNTGAGVYTCNLGEPVASGPTDAWSTSNLTAGTGYQYCWTANPTYSTMMDMISPVSPPPSYTYTTLAGNSYTDYYLLAGTYTPRQSFYGLIGTSLNGNWQLKVTDYYPQDNGYLFDWSISLNANLPDSIVTLTEPIAPTISAATTPANCGVSNGGINLSVGGTAPPYSYLWNNGSSNQNLSNLSAGIYTVTITDNNNCIFEHIVNLSNTGIVNPIAVLTNESCIGAADGAIDLSMGVGSFSYSWSNGATSQDLASLAPNTYSVTIDDGANCQYFATYTINAALPLTMTNSIQQENCGDREGAIQIAVLGGLAPYQYNWSNGQTNQNISDLQQGDYKVTVTDANACSLVDSFSVINLVGNCVPSCDLSITNYQLTHEACLDGMGAIDLTTYTTGGNIFYAWSNGNTTQDVSGLSAGNYSLTMTDANGCTQIETYIIHNQTNGLTISSMQVLDEICGNGLGELSPIIYGGIQPYTFLWSNGSTTRNLSGLSIGNYTCTVVDASGCSSSLTSFVDDNISFSILYASIFDASCNDTTGSIDITLSPTTNCDFLWSNGVTTQALRAVPAGVYSCTITNTSSGCILVSPDYVVNNSSGNFQLDDVDIDSEQCGNGEGEINLVALGGVLPYTYQWNTGATTNRINNLSTGSYEATITDNNGCVIHTGSLNVGNTSGALSIDQLTVLDEYCNNNRGAIGLQVSGNTGALSFLWNTGSTAQNISNLAAGNYFCTISDTLGCVVYPTAQINNNSGNLAIVNTILTHENCSQENGRLELIVSGGLMPYSYQWSTGDTLSSLTNLTAGDYFVTITDAQGCQVSGMSTIQNNTANLLVTLSSLTNEVCGDHRGGINLTLLNGIQPINYLWSNGETVEDLTNLSSGNYTCTITDSNSCPLVLGPYMVDNSSTLVQGITNITEESCNNQNGAIDLSISGGVVPYSYQWSNGNTNQDILNIFSGIYTCTIVDATGCILEVTETVPKNSGNLSIANAQLTDEYCSNAQGAINLIVMGGTAPNTYLWSNGSTLQNLLNLNSGNYEITLSDANNCNVTATYAIANNTGSFQLGNIVVTNERCNDNQGAIDVAVLGGQHPYTYQWSNSEISKSISGLVAGVYHQTITDNSGCAILHTVNVQNTAGSLLVSNDSLVHESCNNQNGSVNISVTGGLLPYSYQWSTGDTTEYLTNLAAGVYTCVITDMTGCVLSYTTTVDNLGGDLHIANMGVLDNNCQRSNGSVTASITGGDAPYAYNWSTTVTNPCGYYTLNMYSSSPFGWGGTPQPLINVYINGIHYAAYTIPFDLYYIANGTNNTFRSVHFPVCQGDSIHFGFVGNPRLYELLDQQGNLLYDNRLLGNFTPPYVGIANTFFQGQGTNVITGLSTGNYTLTVTDSNGCALTQTVDVNTVNTPLTISASLVNEICGQANGAIDVSVQGNTNPIYAWNNGTGVEDLININAGTYSVTVTDNYGCSITDTYTILNNANGIEVIDTVITMDSCLSDRGAIGLSLVGGQTPYSFEWNNGLITKDILGLTSGLYQLTITDFSGCSKMESYIVGNITNGITVSSSVIDEDCTGSQGSIDLTVIGGTPPYNYQWSNNSTTQDITGLSVGVYNCSITDATGCTYLWGDTIQQNVSSIAIPNAIIYKEPCNTQFTAGVGGAIYLTASGGVSPYDYLWSNGSTTQNLLNIPNGTYSLTITDSIGCQLTDTFFVDVRDPVFIGDTTIVPDICNNGQGAIDLTFTGIQNRTYQWNTGATTQDVTGLSAGNYTVTISHIASGVLACEKEMLFSVPSNSGTLNLDTFVYVNETCTQSNGLINISMSGGALPYSYSWSTGATIEDLNGLNANFYTVTITDSLGCEVASPSIEIKNFTYGLGLSGAFLTDEQCGFDGMIDIVPSGGQLPYAYNWSTGDTNEDLTSLDGGIYYLTLTDGSGCTFMDSFVINSGANALNIVPQIIDATCGLSNGAITLTTSGGVGPYTYQWFNGTTNVAITGLSTGNYPVTISDMNGCVVTVPIAILDTSSAVNLLSVDTTNTSCSGCSNGAINLDLDTIGSPYTFLWSNGETTEDLANVIAGTYQVTITNVDGCILDTSFVISTSVGILKIPSLMDVKVYPNPSDGALTIEFNTPLTEVANIHVYNNLGQTIYARKLDLMDLENKVNLRLDDVISGVYLLQLTTDKKYFTQKIIIH